MTDITQEISIFANDPNIHGTLTGIIKNRLQNQIIKKRKNYFGVTDICNPLQTYFKIKYPDKFKDSIETKKRFALGNKQHNIIQKKLESFEGFFDREIVFDGRINGIDLIGRADTKIGENIWEIKSKESLPETIEELIEKYPQDIEQLCFYSLLDPDKPSENILILTTHLDVNKIKAYKVIINNLGKIKNLALQRINQLNKWLDSDEIPQVNFKCRYCYNDCSIKNENLCHFHENQNLVCEVKDFIEITEAPEIDQKIKAIETPKKDIHYVNISNIISPKKVIYREHEDIEEEPYDYSENLQNKQLIQEALFQEDFFISQEDLKKLKEKQKIPEINQYRDSFIKLKMGANTEIYPSLIHISASSFLNSLNNVSTYKKGELGIHCLNNGFTKGYLISFFPKQDNQIRIYEINYRFEKGALSKIKQIVDIIKIKDKERLEELSNCPDFMCGDCAFREVCLGS